MLRFHPSIHPLLCCWFHSQSSCIEISSIHPSIHPSIGVLFDRSSSWAKPLVVLTAQKVCRSGMIPGLQGKGA
jgi:hypothetical protein